MTDTACIFKCPEYDPAEIEKCLREMLDKFGGAGHLFAGKKTIAVKPNLLKAVHPDAAVTTGWGNFASTDTAGTQAQGLQAFTFAWVRHEGAWRVLQAHFSSQLTGLQRAQRPEAAPPPSR